MSFVITAVAAAFVEGAATAVILTAITEVGVAMSVVGTLTKSRELMQLGGAMSVVGGVGGLVNGAIGMAAGAAADGAAGAAAGSLGSAAADGAEAGWAGMASDAVASTNTAAAAPLAFDGASAAATGIAPTTPGLASANSLASFLGTPSTSASGVAGIVPDASGAIATDTSSPFLNDYGLPAGGATDKALGVTGPLGVQDVATPADGGMMSQMKSKLGAAWDSLDSRSKAEVLKSALAMPGGIQNQKNVEAGLAIQQQKVNQSSYGSQVPTFGIIAKAQKG